MKRALVVFATFALCSFVRAASVPVVNINTATETQIAFLPGVGPKLATAIYDYAESGADGPNADEAKCDHRCHFKSVEDLAKVKGIGPKKIAALRPFVVVTGATTATAKIRTAKGGAK